MAEKVKETISRSNRGTTLLNRSKTRQSPESLGPFSLPTRRVIIDLVDQIIGRIELELSSYKNLDKLNLFRLPFITHADNKTMGDALLTFGLLNKHRFLENRFKFVLAGIQKLDQKLGWADALNLLQKFKREIIANRNMATDSMAKLTVVRPKHEYERKYKIIINDNYERPITVDSIKPSWKLLLDVAINMHVLNDDGHKAALDYLNSNKQSRLYTRTGYAITQILKAENPYIKAAIDLNAISEREYHQHLNALKTT